MGPRWSAALVALTAGALAGCGDDDTAATAPQIAVGVPVRGELLAANPGGGSRLTLTHVSRRGMHPRDVCLRLALVRQRPAEADEHCVVRHPRGGVVELRASKGVPDALGSAVSVVAGHAGARVRKLLLEIGPASRELPLSAHRAFLAVLPGSYRGPAALIARNSDGTVARQAFALPPPLVTRPRHRRPGAVSGGEIGKDVIGKSRNDLVERLGAPAGRRGSCLRYEAVGGVPSAWVLCLRNGRVVRGWGSGW